MGNKTNERIGRYVLPLLPLFFMAAGLVCTVYWGRDAYRAVESYSWPKTKGLVIASGVDQIDKRDPDFHYKSLWRSHVYYEFEVQGSKHQGNCVSFGEHAYDSSSKASDAISDYPVGKNVSVYYRSSDPDLCFLEPGITFSLVSSALFGPIMLGIWTLIGILVLKERRRLGAKP